MCYTIRNCATQLENVLPAEMVEQSAQLEQHTSEVKIQGSDTTGQR